MRHGGKLLCEIDELERALGYGVKSIECNSGEPVWTGYTPNNGEAARRPEQASLSWLRNDL